MKIAIFGGTFDPPHIGHKNIINETLKAGIVDKVIIIPAFIPPHKKKGDVTDYKIRCEMTEILFKDFADVKVSKIEKELSGKASYTVNTLKELDRKYPDDQFCLLIGSDSLMNLHSWYQCEKLIENWDIFTYPRPDFEISRDELKKHWNTFTFNKLYKNILTFPVIKCSSSDIRRKIHCAKDVSKLLTDDLSCYIINRKLYI